MVSSTPRPHFTPGKAPVPILQEAGWAPGPVWTDRKSRPPPGFDPGPSSPSSVAIPTELTAPSTSMYLGKCNANKMVASHRWTTCIYVTIPSTYHDLSLYCSRRHTTRRNRKWHGQKITTTKSWTETQRKIKMMSTNPQSETRAIPRNDNTNSDVRGILVLHIRSPTKVPIKSKHWSYLVQAHFSNQ
jgi:hypothetical protein